MTTHVIVVGGGIVGCATAYFCARDGPGIQQVISSVHIEP